MEWEFKLMKLLIQSLKLDMKVNGIKDCHMDKENILLKIDQLIKDKLNTIKDKGKENINGKMAVFMMVLGEMIEWKEQEFLLT